MEQDEKGAVIMGKTDYKSIKYGDFEFRRYTDGYIGIREPGRMLVTVLSPKELKIFMQFMADTHVEEPEAECCGNCSLLVSCGFSTGFNDYCHHHRQKE